jgi:hypothetical protein
MIFLSNAITAFLVFKLGEAFNKTVQPTTMPTSYPTLTLESNWEKDLTNKISQLKVKLKAGQELSTYSEFLLDNAIKFGGVNNFQSYINGELRS